MMRLISVCIENVNHHLLQYLSFRKKLNILFEATLKSVSSECARSKSSVAQKPEDHPKIFNW